MARLSSLVNLVESDLHQQEHTVTRKHLFASLAGIALLAAGASVAAAALQLTGAGSSFDNPFFQAAFYQYSRSNAGAQVNYQSIGSGGGIQQFTAKTVDFGASDVPLAAAEMQAAVAAGGEVVEIPVTLGGVAIAYNVANVPTGIRLTPSVLADIFLGNITNWNDPQIARLNPGISFPNLPIVVVHRADGSGTTYITTDYLSKISPDWKAKVGTAKVVSWPAPSSVGAKGNEGVAGQISNTPGAIGYVELAYALQNKISYARIRNRDGRYVLPTLDTVRNAAAQKPNVSPSDFSIVDMPGADSYPICGYSWVMLWKHQPDAAKGQALVNLFRWLVTSGQQYAVSVKYVSLPPNVQHEAATALAGIRT
jgi:phosphate transport system substrate-binding protein